MSTENVVRGGSRDVVTGLGRAVGLGLLAGLRVATPCAALSRAAAAGEVGGLDGTWLAFLASPRAARVFRLMALGERIADKLPFTPNRTSPGPLFGRAAGGGLVGAASFGSARLPVPLGLACGAALSVLGSFAGYRGRRFLDTRTGWPDAIVGAAEDALAFTAGRAVVRRPRIGFALVPLALAALAARPTQ